MDQQKPTNQPGGERLLIWTRRLSFHVELTPEDSTDPEEAYAQVEADGRLAEAVPQDSGVEDIDIEVYPSVSSHESSTLVVTSTEDQLSELSALISRLKHSYRAAKKLHQDVKGNIPCPICGKPIRFSIDGWPWRSSGVCPTPGCLNWRE